MHIPLTPDPALPGPLGYAMQLLAALELYARDGEGTGVPLEEQLLRRAPYHRHLNQHHLVLLSDEEALMKLICDMWLHEKSLRNWNMLYVDEPPIPTMQGALRQLQIGLRHSYDCLLYPGGWHHLSPDGRRAQVGKMVVQNFYPMSLSFYAAGPYQETSTYRLPLKMIPASEQLRPDVLAQGILHHALKQRRNHLFEDMAVAHQMNHNVAFRNPLGQIKSPENLTQEEWHQLMWRVPYTSYLDVVEEIKFALDSVSPDEDVLLNPQEFVNTALSFLEHVNTVHELYLKAFLGPKAWDRLLTIAPAYLTERVQARHTV